MLSIKVKIDGKTVPFEKASDVLKSRVEELLLIRLKEHTYSQLQEHLKKEEIDKLSIVFEGNSIAELQVTITGAKKILEKLK